eukprot:CAMPEP_0172187852 /NCGR_PEP_ID=MMETSP1050-20130122/21580_1 /TAXON_ID=233186 /ORGANISM="Cryptomonas curvata, Strain CCAP979/52" /LENGTH=241 /DNA_ID=CAMNT_0012862245 /DNA_START=201 /DNA_END=922 /DNA_ORIENTATION=+
MATWNLESVGTKGYGGGGSYFCARAARAFLKQREEHDSDLLKDGSGIFKDPLMDTVYGQCTSSTRAAALAADAAQIQELGRMNELEQALAAARAYCQHEGSRTAASRESSSDRFGEEVHVVFEEPFTARSGRHGGGIPLVCLGSGEHAVYVMRVTYNGRRWTVERRFSEFDDLDKELTRLFSRDPSVRLSHFPSKKWVGGLSRELLDRRKQKLEAYVQDLVAQAKLVRTCDPLRAFLEIPP